MNKRILMILFVFVLILGLSIVSAENSEINDTAELNHAVDADIQENENLQTNDVEINDDEILSSQDEDLLSDGDYYPVNGAGSQTVDFNDGYRAYCINSTLRAASSNDYYSIGHADDVTNAKNDNVANYIKWIFYEYYDLALSDEAADKDVIQGAIWAFMNGEYRTSNAQIQGIIDHVTDLGRYHTLNDDNEVKQDGDKELVFSFKVFTPQNLNPLIQSYFGFKYEMRDIEPDNDKIEELDEPVDNNNQTNTTNETENNNQTNETENVENTTVYDEEIDSPIEDGDDEEVIGNSSVPSQEENTNTSIQSLSNSTGNPLAVLLVILISLGISPNFRRKD